MTSRLPYRFWSFLVLCALCFVRCALCFVLCALCFVLCALCFVLCENFGQVRWCLLLERIWGSLLERIWGSLLERGWCSLLERGWVRAKLMRREIECGQNWCVSKLSASEIDAFCALGFVLPVERGGYGWSSLDETYYFGKSVCFGNRLAKVLRLHLHLQQNSSMDKPCDRTPSWVHLIK